MNRWLSRIYALTVLLVASSAQADNWPGWRGPTGMGYTHEKDLPLTWDGKTKENLLWKAPLVGGIGWSSPIVWGDRVFVTTSVKQSAKEQNDKLIPEHWVSCFQVADGKEIWRTSVPPGPIWRGNVYAVPTPVTDGKLIFCWFGSAVYTALDFDGKIVWRHELPGPVPQHVDGLLTSPILFEDTVIRVLNAEQSAGKGFLQALDKKTGKVKWEKKLDRGYRCNATPIILPIDGKLQLVLTSSSVSEGLNPVNGETIWSCRFGGVNSSPAYGSGLFYLDNFITRTAMAVDPSGKGDITKTHVKWTVKAMGEWSSPVVCGDFVYRTKNPDLLQCLKLSTGEAMYSERLAGLNVLVSPIVTPDERIYILTPGKSYVIKAGPKLEVLAINELRGHGNAGSSPAVSDGRIFVRDHEPMGSLPAHLYCVGKK
jgi:outer membrane protein assembly factor BamB